MPFSLAWEGCAERVSADNVPQIAQVRFSVALSPLARRGGSLAGDSWHKE